MTTNVKQQAYYLLKVFGYDFYRMKDLIVIEYCKNIYNEFNYILCTTTAKSFVYKFNCKRSESTNKFWEMETLNYKDVFKEEN